MPDFAMAAAPAASRYSRWSARQSAVGSSFCAARSEKLFALKLHGQAEATRLSKTESDLRRRKGYASQNAVDGVG